MTVRLRVVSVLGLLVALAIGIGLLGLYGVHQSNEGLRNVYENQSKSLESLTQIEQMTERNHLAVTWMLLDPLPANLESETRLIKQNLASIDALLQDFRATELSPEEAGTVEKLATAHSTLTKDGYGPIFEMLDVMDLDGVNQHLKGKLVPLLKPVNDALQVLRHHQVAKTRGEYEEGRQRYSTLRLTMFAAIVLAAIAVGTAGYLLVRNLYRQLGGEPEYSSAVVRRIAAGDLSAGIDINPRDTHSLLYAMKSMQAQLIDTVNTIRQTTDLVATGASEIASGNMDLSRRTEQQASSLEQTADSIKRLTDTVRNNSEHAQQARSYASTASEVATQGGAVVARVVNTMGEINESSRKIADITSVIDGIAFQTNILALNAAVEAARAGEQGRGFAVVATEVRTLAQRSAAAAKEIKQLISDSTSKVEHGTVLVDEAGKTMDKIMESVQRVNDLIAEIAAASAEQTAGIEQVNQAVTQMDIATQQNAALVEQAAAAASSLQEQAEILMRNVGFFKLPQRDHEPQLRTIHVAEPAALAHATPMQIPNRSDTHA